MNLNINQDGFGRHISHNNNINSYYQGFFQDGARNGHFISMHAPIDSIYNTNSNNNLSNKITKISIGNIRQDSLNDFYLHAWIYDNKDILNDITQMKEDNSIVKDKIDITSFLGITTNKADNILIKIFYGRDISDNVREGLILDSLTIMKERSIYKGKIKDGKYDDEKGFYYSTQSDIAYTGVFKDGIFMEGYICKHAKDNTNYIVYRYNKNQQPQFSKVLDLGSFEEHFNLISFGLGEEKFSFDDTTGHNYNVYEYFYQLVVKSMSAIHEVITKEYLNNKANLEKIHKLYEYMTQLRERIFINSSS